MILKLDVRWLSKVIYRNGTHLCLRTVVFQVLLGSFPTTNDTSILAFLSKNFLARPCNFPAYSRSSATRAVYISRVWWHPSEDLEECYWFTHIGDQFEMWINKIGDSFHLVLKLSSRKVFPRAWCTLLGEIDHNSDHRHSPTSQLNLVH